MEKPTIIKPLVGLITFHSAYNFGSVLQTYATIKKIEELGYPVETINYRTPSQTFMYKKDWGRGKGLINNIKNYGFPFIQKAREIRRQKYEDFINKFLNPSKQKYTSFSEIKNSNLTYDILISGSDQVWNPNIGEFKFEPADAILPYFLQFGYPQKRIAYASSVGAQSLRNIRKYKDYLNSYNYLSTREYIAAEYLKTVSEKEIEFVCDPTWLLPKEQWRNLIRENENNNKKRKPYILVYLLYFSFRAINYWMDYIIKLAEKFNLDIICISPMNFYQNKKINVIQDAGPLDILSYLDNAELVITNTFHGTIFSMNLEKNFYSLKVDPSSRQGQMLKLCKLEDRTINSPSELLEDEDYLCNFDNSSLIIENFRKSSINFLNKALLD